MYKIRIYLRMHTRYIIYVYDVYILFFVFIDSVDGMPGMKKWVYHQSTYINYDAFLFFFYFLSKHTISSTYYSKPPVKIASLL